MLYNHGNQPCLHNAWLFNYSGRPWLTQKWTRTICHEFYGTEPLHGYGYGQDEDQGQLGAWYVMASLGLFDVQGHSAAEPTFQFGSPLFEKVSLRFHAGIALHVGEVVTGPLGVGKGDFTLVGDAVNITFRIEELTRALGKDVVVTKEFLEGWEEGAGFCAAEGEHQVKGRAQPVDLYSVERFPDTASA